MTMSQENQFCETLSRRKFASQLANALLGVGVLPQVFASENWKDKQGYGKAKRAIYLYMAGGMSHLDTFDPKPSSEYTGSTEAIKTNVDDVFVSQYLPKTAQIMDRMALIRSMNSTQGAHEQGNYFMHTSYSSRGTIRHPSMGAWLAKVEGKMNQTLPSSVVVCGGSRHPGKGFFDTKYAPLMIGNPEAGLPGARLKGDLTTEKLQRRLQLAEELDLNFHKKYKNTLTDSYTDAYEEAFKLLSSEDLKAFDVRKEKDKVRDKYGRNRFGQGCLLARRLMECDVRFVEVVLGNWDTHVDNFTSVQERCAVLDRAIHTLILDLENKGMLEDTMVVLATEFGRTPEINSNDGRDHYPSAFTCLMAGGGVQGGQVIGATDANGANVEGGVVKVPDFNATIAHALGLPLDHVEFSGSKRPFTPAHKGKPVLDLFG